MLPGLGVRRTLSDLAEKIAEAVLPASWVVPRQEPKTIEAARSGIGGLMCVGVEFKEAFPSFAKGLKMEDAIALSGEFAPNGIERMRALYEVQQDFRDKKAFGQACLEAGFHPAGVALAAIEYEGNSGKELVTQTRGTPKKAATLLKAFGVDTWINVENIGVSLDCLHKKSFSAPLFVPCHLYIRTTWSAKATNVPFLAHVGGILFIDNSQDLCFPDLKAVDDYLSFAGAENISMPTLKIVGRMDARKSINFSAPQLEEIRDVIFAKEFASLSMPKLRVVGGALFAQDSSGLDLPALIKTNILDLRHAENPHLPLLEEVVQGVLHTDCRGGDLSRLRLVEGKAVSVSVMDGELGIVESW